MIRSILLILILLSFSANASSSVDKKINTNKKILKNKSKQKTKTKLEIKKLAKQINSANTNLSNLENKIIKLEKKITTEQKKLKQSKKKLKTLQVKSGNILDLKEKVQNNIIDTLINNYSSSIAIELASKSSIEQIVNSNIYRLLSQDSKLQLKELDTQYNQLLENQKSNQNLISKLNKFIKKDQKNKVKLSQLTKKHNKTISKLKIKHKLYQKELKKIATKQRDLTNLLGKLNIIKKDEIKKAKESRKKWLAKLKKKQQKSQKITKKKSNKKDTSIQTVKNFNKDIKMNVRSIGSSSSGIRTTKYRGRKTIAPLKQYKIIKKFGNSYDKVYKIKFFNDSITLKTKNSNAKVLSILSGKVVYSKKDSQLLDNVVIVQHKNNLHTIYSHLDKIAPTIRKGKWVKKGSVLGRVNVTLVFQATKNSKYINPKELF